MSTQREQLAAALLALTPARTQDTVRQYVERGHACTETVRLVGFDGQPPTIGAVVDAVLDALAGDLALARTLRAFLAEEETYVAAGQSPYYPGQHLVTLDGTLYDADPNDTAVVAAVAQATTQETPA